MAPVWFVDTASFIHAAKAGFGSWTPGQPLPPTATFYLEQLFNGNQRTVINDLVLEEIARGSGNDNGFLENWIGNKVASGDIELDALTPAELEYYRNLPNGGERSLIEVTAEKPAFYAPLEDRRFISDENFTQKQFFTDKGYTDEHWRSNPGIYDERYQASGADADFKAGADYARAARSAGLHDNQIFGRPMSKPWLGDSFRALLHDETGAATLPGGRHWNDLTDYVRNNKLLLAGEAVGAAAVVLDAAFTRQAFAEALARGDLAAADEILGGLVGRAFGGAFAAVIAGAAGGSIFGPPGAIVGAILGGIVGAIGGGEIGEWLFGALNDLGLSLSSLIDDISGMLRDALYDPLVLDLDGDGIELVALTSSNTRFDLDDDGIAERAGWVGPHDGLLVHDENGNGLVDGVAELVGSGTVDGFDELRTLDANNDGRIDALDPAFADLRVWRDLDRDGVSTPDEMLTLAQAGITRFNLAYTQTDADVSGNVVARTGSYVRADGSSRAMASVQFALDQTTGRPVLPQGADVGDLLVLPNLPGSAAVPDLRAAMYFDPALMALVEQLVFGNHGFDTFADFAGGGVKMDGPASTFGGRFLEVLYRWTGVDTSVPPDPDRPYYYDVFEALTGMRITPDSHSDLDQLAAVWPQLVKQLGVQFLFQAAQKPAMQSFLDFAQDLAALDPESPTYLDSVSTLAETAIAATATVTPAYAYLDHFTGLSLDPTTGAIAGDFDAFAARFIDDQPPFFTAWSVAGSGSGVGRITMSWEGAVETRHPWTAWFEDQGSLLFHIAGAMDLGPDYLLNVTGWRWLAGEATDLHGADGADLIDQAITYYYREELTTAADGSRVLNTIGVETRDQRMFGYEGDDELRGNDGVDRLVGGPGDDLLVGGSGSDMYVYASGDGLDRIVDASGADDTIYFSSELNRADLGVARLAGTGDLLLYFGADQSQGIVLAGQWSASGSAVEHYHFVGEDGLDAGDVASLYLATLATAGADAIGGSWAGERVIGLGGNDTLNGHDGDDTLDGGDGADWLSGDYGKDLLLGGADADTLLGQHGNDVLDGGAGDDLMRGGGGDDTYLFARGGGQDVVRDYIAATLVNHGGFDRGVMAADISPEQVSVSQADGGRDLILAIAGTDDRLTLDNTVNDGGYRIEQVIFADGTVWTHADLMALATAPTDANDVFYGGYDNDTLAGGAGNDTLIAHRGNDVLDGVAGDDLMRGGGGDDTYVFALGSGEDVVRDYIAATLVNHSGFDTVLLGAGIAPADVTVSQGDGGRDLILAIAGTGDRLTLDDTINDSHNRIEEVIFADGTVWTHAELIARATAPTADDDTYYGSYDGESLSGGAGDDAIYARAGDDILAGGSGSDWLDGGSGRDAADYGWTTAGVTVDLVAGTASGTEIGVDQLVAIEDVIGGAGNDAIAGDGVGNMLAGGAGHDSLSGGGGGDLLDGGAGNDILDGGVGADAMTGGAGDDIFIVEDPGDLAVEGADGGIDQVRSSITFTLGAHIENLTLTGAAAIHGIGNALANTLIGNGAANALDGGAGADIMKGGGGHDSYHVDDPADKIFELAGEGTDLVISSVTFTLDPNIENLTLTGSAAIDGTGNALANVIVGTSGANVLNGAAGADVMKGGHGDDSYHVDDAGDRVEELSTSGGIDLVMSWIDFALGLNVENLKLNGAAVTGTGNALANVLTGSTGNNWLYGGEGGDTLQGSAGDDHLYGGAGPDTLHGGSGIDHFCFDAASGTANVDTILDFTRGIDRIALDSAAFAGLADGALPASALVIGMSATTADHRIVYDPATGALYFDADGSGAGAAVHFATLDTRPSPLAASDFVVI